MRNNKLKQTVGALRRAIKLLSNEMCDKIYKKHETTNNSESKNEE
jgi:hypothetical protein